MQPDWRSCGVTQGELHTQVTPGQFCVPDLLVGFLINRFKNAPSKWEIRFRSVKCILWDKCISILIYGKHVGPVDLGSIGRPPIYNGGADPLLFYAFLISRSMSLNRALLGEKRVTVSYVSEDNLS